MKIKLYILSFYAGVLFSFSAHAQNPILWGMTSEGGTGSIGNIFQTDLTGSAFKSDYPFYTDNAFNPLGNVVQMNDSMLFGMTYRGGVNEKGIIFSYNITTGQFTDVHDFAYLTDTDGQSPFGSLIQASNGLIYGLTTYGGKNDVGTIFNYNISTGKETVLYDFGGTGGLYPYGSLIQASNGLLYGMTESGGANTNVNGIIFSYNISTGAETEIHDFGIGNDGQSPYGSLIQANDSLLYGMTSSGGTNKWYGVIFSYNISTGIETALYNFGNDTTDGQTPYGSLIQASDSLLYGMTSAGGVYHKGIIFSYNITTGTETLLHSFGNDTDGFTPYYGSLMQASDGLLYGMTRYNNTNTMGTIFSYNISTDIEATLHNFGNGTDGAMPIASLIQANNGLLYGMTQAGGKNFNYTPGFGDGTLFSFNISNDAETDLHDFVSDTGSIQSNGSLIRTTNGLLYGMTTYGGIYDQGTLFSYNTASNQEIILHVFGNGTDGIEPYGSIIQLNNGLLYGMTNGGGINNGGIIFSYDISNATETDIYDFGNSINDGIAPYGSLMQASDGLLYGTNAYGGAYFSGTIFSYNISTAIGADVHYFAGSSNDGANPYGSLIEVDGLLYGLTEEGGGDSVGTIFSYDISTGLETIKHDFGNSGDGWWPNGSLIKANNGLLYGMTWGGGANDSGIIFSYNPSTGEETNLYNFGNGTDGAHPNGSLIQASDGKLYGMTTVGGIYGFGTIFNFDISTNTENVIHNFTGIDGDLPQGDLLEIDTSKQAGLNQPFYLNDKILLYPNPNSGNFTIQLQNIKQQAQIEIFNVLGEKIYTANLNSTNTQINLSNQPAGIYLYHVLDEQGNQIGSGKFIVE